MVKDARASYFMKLICACKRNPKTLFETVNNTVSPTTSLVPVFSNNDCNNVLSHFVDKVMAVRANTASSANPLSYPTKTVNFGSFSPISLNEIIK